MTYDPAIPTYYFYPPLLAIVLRPFAAVLPYHVFAIGWEAVIVASLVALLRRLGANRVAFVALGILGMPIAWAVAIAQAHVPMTLLMAIGQPWSIALATNIKLFPVLIAVWWLGRRQYQAVGALIGWLALLAFLQWIIEPAGSTAFFGAVGLDETVGVQQPLALRHLADPVGRPRRCRCRRARSSSPRPAGAGRPPSPWRRSPRRASSSTCSRACSPPSASRTRRRATDPATESPTPPRSTSARRGRSISLDRMWTDGPAECLTQGSVE